MKKNNGLKLLTLVCFSMTMSVIDSQVVNVQQVNTMYFMENLPQRNELNPAFQPFSDFYLGLPVIGYTRFSLGNSSPLNTKFSFNPDKSNMDNFYNSLSDFSSGSSKDYTEFETSARVNFLSFGFRNKKIYWNFSLSENIVGKIGIPKSIFKLWLTPENVTYPSSFDNFNTDLIAYTEAAVGYSREVNDKWSYGGKLKFLYGNNHVVYIAQNTKLTATADSLKLIEGGQYYRSSSSLFSLKPAGLGGAIDLGFTFKPFESLTLSASATDLGLIHWNQKLRNNKLAYSGSKIINNGDNIGTLIGMIKDELSTSVNDSTEGGYNSYLTPKINVGAELSFLDNKLSLGLLSRTILMDDTIHRVNQEVTFSINGRPAEWVNLSVSYSLFNGKQSLGAGLGLRTGPLHWFLSADYVPLSNNSLYLKNMIPIPYNRNGFNIGLGLTIALGNRKDADRDGVNDKFDLCPDTPKGIKVNKDGCPIDSDGDGVPDYLDKCPNSPKDAIGFVDKDGCLIDTDKDGVADFIDKCPDTPKDAIGFVDKDGCTLDSDKDGVPDYLDKCPNSPADAKDFVDKNGCLVDTDGDGIPDYLDLCPNTPSIAKGFVDKNGCTLDSDGDGVPDYLDKCPNTAPEAHGMVDASGCPRDTDGDGVPDYLDKCPTIPGSIRNSGCPESKPDVKVESKPKPEPVVIAPSSKEEITINLKVLFEKALQGIQFEAARYTIKPISFDILDQIADALNKYPLLNIEIQGHTDNLGKHEINQMLSEKRAQAVFTYLVLKGVDARRMSYRGYGDNLPTATNKTAEGRTLNRRVEFVITYAK